MGGHLAECVRAVRYRKFDFWRPPELPMSWTSWGRSQGRLLISSFNVEKKSGGDLESFHAETRGRGGGREKSGKRKFEG